MNAALFLCLCGEPAGQHATHCPRPEYSTDESAVEAWLLDMHALQQRHSEAWLDSLSEETARHVRSLFRSEPSTIEAAVQEACT